MRLFYKYLLIELFFLCLIKDSYCQYESIIPSFSFMSIDGVIFDENISGIKDFKADRTFFLLNKIKKISTLTIDNNDTISMQEFCFSNDSNYITLNFYNYKEEESIYEKYLFSNENIYEIQYKSKSSAMLDSGYIKYNFEDDNIISSYTYSLLLNDTIESVKYLHDNKNRIVNILKENYYYLNSIVKIPSPELSNYSYKYHGKKVSKYINDKIKGEYFYIKSNKSILTKDYDLQTGISVCHSEINHQSGFIIKKSFCNEKISDYSVMYSEGGLAKSYFFTTLFNIENNTLLTKSVSYFYNNKGLLIKKVSVGLSNDNMENYSDCHYIETVYNYAFY
jgi:hypothetical protein